MYDFSIHHIDPNRLVRKLHVLAQKYNDKKNGLMKELMLCSRGLNIELQKTGMLS